MAEKPTHEPGNQLILHSDLGSATCKLCDSGYLLNSLGLNYFPIKGRWTLSHKVVVRTG